MTTNEVYEKYRHLDALLSDREFLGDELRMVILADLWQAVRLTSGYTLTDDGSSPVEGDAEDQSNIVMPAGR